MDSVGAKVKKFFAKKKSDAKFAKAGPGRKLTADSGSGSSSSSSKPKAGKDAYVPVKRDDLSDEMKKARDAALERMTKNTMPSFDLSLKAIKEKARKELEEENKQKLESDMSNMKISEEPKQAENAIEINYACPLISDEILPKKEWKQKIKDFLYEQLAMTQNSDDLDPGITSCLIIKSCNTIERAEDCCETLKKYLANIVADPAETKFHKIRMSNRIFCDKVANVEGSSEFLKNAGFTEQVIDGESFLVWSPESSSIEHLLKLVDYLNECETIQLELDRNLQVLLPSQNNEISLSQEFFKLTADELKREQTNKTAVVEDALVLKTKAMREKEQERYVKRFKYSVIRVRFPDGLFLQGTFSVYERLSNVFEFVAGQLQHGAAEFSLYSPDGVKFTDEDLAKTLYALRLVPNCILKFTYENESKSLNEYLKDETLMLVRPV